MIYLLALFFPFLAVLFVGKPFQALVNLVIWLFGFATFGAGCLVALIHAVCVIHGAHQDRRMRKIIGVMQGHIYQMPPPFPPPAYQQSQRLTASPRPLPGARSQP